MFEPMRSIVITTSIAIALLVGCGSEDTQESDGSTQNTAPSAPAAEPTAGAAASESAPSDSARQEAKTIFESRCATCHGPEGRGNGPASQGLTPPPRDFHDPEWQKSVTDEHIEQIVQYGGAAVGRSPAMPSNPDLMSKPDVVAALREHVRELGDG